MPESTSLKALLLVVRLCHGGVFAGSSVEGGAPDICPNLLRTYPNGSNILADEWLDGDFVVKEHLTTESDGKRYRVKQ